MNALHAGISDKGPVRLQSARKNIEVLLRHLRESGTRRTGRLLDGEQWLDAANREHDQFPFGGILVRSSPAATAHVVGVDRLGEEECPTWSPPAPPVVRDGKELAKALAPLLRCAAKVRFVDPYFDPDDPSFFEPMAEYLLVAQRRRNVADLQIQLHFTIHPDEVRRESELHHRQLTEGEVARNKLAACERRLGPLLRAGVGIRAFAWRQGSGGFEMHNRYVLSEVGGVAVQTGLDQHIRGKRQTDDLTILSKEQHETRWAEFCPEGNVYRLVESSAFTGAPEGTG
jgi:hypothetical protein